MKHGKKINLVLGIFDPLENRMSVAVWSARLPDIRTNGCLRFSAAGHSRFYYELWQAQAQYYTEDQNL